MKWIICALVCLVAFPAHAQMTQVTAQVKDPNGFLYVNCQWSVVFVGQNTTPGAGPYQPSSLLNGQQGKCDSQANLTVTLADNINTISPTPSQWSFSICSAPGYQPGGTYCKSNMLVTITGATQDLTSFFQPLMPLLPTSGGGGGGGGSPPGGANNSVQINNSGAFGGVLLGSGQVLTGTAAGGAPVAQKKAIYDVRDYATCDTPVGSTTGTDATIGINTLLSIIGTQAASIRIIGSHNVGDSCLVSTINWPSNVNLDFSGGGSLTLINTLTPTGNMRVDGTVATSPAAGNTATTSCSVTLNVPTAGDGILVMATVHFASGGGTNRPADTLGNVYRLISTASSDTNHYVTNSMAWLASDSRAGSTTITIPILAATNNLCAAFAIAGGGPSLGQDGAGATSGNSAGTTSPMSTVQSATYTAGSMIVGFGGQTTNTQACTPQSGFTQLVNIGTNMNFCVQEQNASAGGSLVLTTAINNTPTASYWMYNSVGIKPIYSTETVLGGIFNPNLHQIFYSASTPGQSSIDFTGNLTIDKVYPEWWGACNSCTPTLNTMALQAAVGGAWGSHRTNASGLIMYNKTLFLTTDYQINGELKLYSVNGFKIAGLNRLVSGITQTAPNLRIVDGQSTSYGDVEDIHFAGTASSNNALVDLDYDGVETPNDLRPQFIDFHRVTWNGNNVVNVGLIGAKSGGGAQYSNINCYDCNVQGFTQAGWQVGGTPTGGANPLAQNALAITWWNGDMQSNPQYGFANYGGGYIQFFGTSMENGFTTQTGADFYSQDAQGTIALYNVRSESRNLCWCSYGQLFDVIVNAQALKFPPGATPGLNLIYTGNSVSGDGAYYRVTSYTGAFGGVPLSYASSGTSTSLTDTNQTMAGSVTTGFFTSNPPDTVTQAGTGSTGSVVVAASSQATVNCSAISPTYFTYHETLTQAGTGVTAREVGQGGVIGVPTYVQLDTFSGTANATGVWTGNTSGVTCPPTSAPTFSASSMTITQATGTPNAIGIWTNGTGGTFVPTSAPVSVNWTANAFVGQTVSVLSGANNKCYGVITSNTANTLTVSNWITQYPTVVCSAPSGVPASMSGFDVEPTWNHGTVTSGGATLQYLNENIISGANDFQAFTGNIKNATLPGNQISIWAAGITYLENIQTTRPDWYSSTLGGNQPQQSTATPRSWDVTVVLPGSVNGAAIKSAPFPTVGATAGASIPLALKLGMGSKAICWNTGNVGGPASPGIPANTSAGEVCVGGRSDIGAANDPSRNLFEVYNNIGPPSPVGTDMPGGTLHLQGGLSSGAGTPGGIEFWIGNTATTSSAVNSARRMWYIDSTGNLTHDVTNNPTGNLVAHTVTNTSLTAGNCVQAGTGGVLTTTSGPCGSGGGSGTVSSGTAGHFTWYAAAGTTVTSNANLDDSVTTAATITSQETIAAPGINVTGSGGITMTGAGGTLPTPAAGQGGLGIGPGNVPQFYSNGGAWTNIGGGTINPNPTVVGSLTYYPAAANSTTVGPVPFGVASNAGLDLGPAILQFGSTTTPASADTGIARIGSGVIGLNNGGNGFGETSFLRSGNSCGLSTAISFTNTGLASQFCLKGIAARAVPWIIHCVIPWDFTAGTGTTTVQFGINSNTAPASTSYFSAMLWSNAGGALTTTQITTVSGNQVLINATGLTASDTQVRTAYIDGVWSASGSSASNLQITAQTGASGITANIEAGAYCRFE